MDDDPPLALIAIVYSQDELAILCSRLEAEDIPVLRHSAGLASVDVATTWALGGIRLFVPREDGERARALLAAAPRWTRSGGVYTRNPVLDIFLALLLGLLCGVAPARIQAVLIGPREEASAG